MTILGWVDLPTDGSQVFASAFYVAGWAFVVETGARPAPLFIGFSSPDGKQHMSAPNYVVVEDHVYRPDVHAMFAGISPNLTDNSAGYNVLVTGAPLGTWDLVVALATEDGQAQWSQTRRVVIV